MPRSTHAPFIAIFIIAAATTAPVGCTARARVESRPGITATYAFRTLHTELEPTVSVLTAIAAAEQALRARGYSITKSVSCEDKGLVVAKPPGASSRDLNKAVVESRVTKTGTSIQVRVEPFGDEAASYAIMDALLARIGR